MAPNQIVVSVGILEGPWSAWQGLTDGLRLEGLAVRVAARDTRSLLEAIGNDPPQVVVLDVAGEEEGRFGFSGQEGLNLLREVRKRRLEVRSLLISPNTSPDFIAQCFEEGAAGYLFRSSVTWQSISQAVHALVRGERLFPVQLLQNDFDHPPTPPPTANALLTLTQREREVLAYVAGGADNLKIAAHLKIAERTVKSHVTQLYRKLGSENRTQLALRACHLGIRPPPDL